ncbi:unnamed protein product, partial [marine sediment metagenome]
LKYFLKDYFVISIAFDSKGTAWIGTLNQGLIRFDGEVFHYNSSNSILSDTIMVPAIDVDTFDNIWIGSNVGLLKHKNKEFVISDKSNSPITHNIRSLAVDKDNSVWFTNGDIYQGGIIQYNGKDWNLYTPDNSDLSSTVIYDITVDEENSKWFTCPDAVVKYSNNNWTVFHSNSSGINFDWVDKITVGVKGDIWISCDYSESSITGDYPTVIKFNGINWSRMDLPKINNEKYITTDIYGDSKGIIWVATTGRELFYYNHGKWNYYCKLPFTIFTIKEDNFGRIWLGTGNGIYIIELP